MDIWTEGGEKKFTGWRGPLGDATDAFFPRELTICPRGDPSKIAILALSGIWWESGPGPGWAPSGGPRAHLAGPVRGHSVRSRFTVSTIG